MKKKSDRKRKREIEVRKEKGYWLPQYSSYQIMKTTTFIVMFIVYGSGWLVGQFMPADTALIIRLILVVFYFIIMSLPVLVFIQRKEVPMEHSDDKNAFTGKAAVIFAIFNLILYIGGAIYLVVSFFN